MKEIKVSSQKVIWTQHSRFKLRQYNFSEKRVLRIIRRPHRVEEGIVEGTIAAMQRAGTKKNPKEVWAMYQLLKNKNGLTIKIISAWRYPGVTPENERPQIPEDTLKELGIL